MRVLHSILALAPVLFWTESFDDVPGICWSHSSSLGVTAPSAPITTGTTLAFSFHVFSSSSLSPWYYSSLLYSYFLMLLSLGFAMSITTAYFFCLSVTIMSNTYISIYFLNTQRTTSACLKVAVSWLCFLFTFYICIRNASSPSVSLLRCGFGVPIVSCGQMPFCWFCVLFFHLLFFSGQLICRMTLMHQPIRTTLYSEKGGFRPNRKPLEDFCEDKKGFYI